MSIQTVNPFNPTRPIPQAGEIHYCADGLPYPFKATVGKTRKCGYCHRWWTLKEENSQDGDTEIFWSPAEFREKPAPKTEAVVIRPATPVKEPHQCHLSDRSPTEKNKGEVRQCSCGTYYTPQERWDDENGIKYYVWWRSDEHGCPYTKEKVPGTRSQWQWTLDCYKNRIEPLYPATLEKTVTPSTPSTILKAIIRYQLYILLPIAITYYTTLLLANPHKAHVTSMFVWFFLNISSIVYFIEDGYYNNIQKAYQKNLDQNQQWVIQTPGIIKTQVQKFFKAFDNIPVDQHTTYLPMIDTVRQACQALITDPDNTYYIDVIKTRTDTITQVAQAHQALTETLDNHPNKNQILANPEKVVELIRFNDNDLDEAKRTLESLTTARELVEKVDAY